MYKTRLLLATNSIEEEVLKAFSFSILVARRPTFTEEGIPCYLNQI